MEIEQLVEIQNIKRLSDIDNLQGMIEIMVFLQKFGKGNMSNFVKDLRLNQQPVYRTLDKLKSLGFITMKSETTKKGNFPAKNYYLTSKGKKLGTHFLSIYDSFREITK